MRPLALEGDNLQAAILTSIPESPGTLCGQTLTRRYILQLSFAQVVIPELSLTIMYLLIYFAIYVR
jgi:hypothetical protein